MGKLNINKAKAGPEIAIGSGWLLVLNRSMLVFGGWLAGNCRISPVVLYTKKQVKVGG